MKFIKVIFYMIKEHVRKCHGIFGIHLHHSYKYSNTVAAKILNFNAIVRNIDIDEFIKSPPSCDCTSSPFSYAPHGHVVTRDFGIIPNEDLKHRPQP